MKLVNEIEIDAPADELFEFHGARHPRQPSDPA